ncbi:disease resistance response protein 206 [Physcomitrium patens]|uniref:Dirigent protein n=1 Tax=Physcomitrium patens TaxID=3218 RepID=A0A2K1JMI4_PHYPA|nr:dirigent protein 9-like [Physcomitrium patens]PNR42747.1 hypothetical protein PHYPA_017577 [Physcomitrium patens]|eukprot:XP_024393433.1 dirigent protein 9-like [Physcomitrella patens]
MVMARTRFVMWVFVALSLSMRMPPSVEASRDGPSSIEFYVHNPGLFTPFPNPTEVVQLAMKGSEPRPRSFKSRIITFNHAITGTHYKNSPVLGRAHGIRVVDKVGDGPLAFTWLFTASFNTSSFDGTLSFQGTTLNFPSSDFSDVAVTGGTGSFRFARGYATFTNFYRDDEISVLEGQHFQVFLRY